jgi:translation initiation factor IF-2
VGEETCSFLPRREEGAFGVRVGFPLRALGIAVSPPAGGSPPAPDGAGGRGARPGSTRGSPSAFGLRPRHLPRGGGDLFVSPSPGGGGVRGPGGVSPRALGIAVSPPQGGGGRARGPRGVPPPPSGFALGTSPVGEETCSFLPRRGEGGVRGPGGVSPPRPRHRGFSPRRGSPPAPDGAGGRGARPGSTRGSPSAFGLRPRHLASPSPGGGGGEGFRLLLVRTDRPPGRRTGPRPWCRAGSGRGRAGRGRRWPGAAPTPGRR